MKNIKNLSTILLILSLAALTVTASENFQLQIAIMQEDIERLTKQNGTLQLQLEAIEEENSELITKFDNYSIKQDQLIKNYNISAQNYKSHFGILENKMNQTSQQQKDAIVAEVTHNLETLLRKSATNAQSTPAHQFSENYPKKGIAYIVKSGDTLSVIARNNNSCVKDIQNANYIENPKNLKAGQTIFVPQRNKKD